MLLSVYIISYNQEKFIAKAIESALMQDTEFEYEIVIGDDFIPYHRKFPIFIY